MYSNSSAAVVPPYKVPLWIYHMYMYGMYVYSYLLINRIESRSQAYWLAYMYMYPVYSSTVHCTVQLYGVHV